MVVVLAVVTSIVHVIDQQLMKDGIDVFGPNGTGSGV